MANIKQYTNFDLKEASVAFSYPIRGIYIDYKAITIENQIIKLGYCCGDSFH